ncbi:WhiB family transcriptional regulator [Microbispora sp. CA-102843]|uniref:WhiB family transcriptional regulator n=1 Tax=Microbispora sp. CA-102843 TaxID=3239952 RepID=UPI003D8AD41F
MTPDALAELFALAGDPGTAWMDWAVCPETDPDLFFAEQADPVSTGLAKAVCAGCPVVSECLAYALEHGLTGVWGGTSQDERKAMRRSRARRELGFAA